MAGQSGAFHVRRVLRHGIHSRCGVRISQRRRRESTDLHHVRLLNAGVVGDAEGLSAERKKERRKKERRKKEKKKERTNKWTNNDRTNKQNETSE
jgi:hypothetical protein